MVRGAKRAIFLLHKKMARFTLLTIEGDLRTTFYDLCRVGQRAQPTGKPGLAFGGSRYADSPYDRSEIVSTIGTVECSETLSGRGDGRRRRWDGFPGGRVWEAWAGSPTMCFSKTRPRK